MIMIVIMIVTAIVIVTIIMININSRLKGAVDRELGGNIYGFPPPRFSKMFMFDECCRKTIFLERFLRIHPVQSVANSQTQLSGRGFPRIFHMKLVLSQLYVFWYSKMEVGPCNLSKTDFSKRELTHRPLQKDAQQNSAVSGLRNSSPLIF